MSLKHSNYLSVEALGMKFLFSIFLMGLHVSPRVVHTFLTMFCFHTWRVHC